MRSFHDDGARIIGKLKAPARKVLFHLFSDDDDISGRIAAVSPVKPPNNLWQEREHFFCLMMMAENTHKSKVTETHIYRNERVYLTIRHISFL
jgi:hypothetical protein